MSHEQVNVAGVGSAHVDVNIQGVRVRISAPNHDDLAKAVDTIREHLVRPGDPVPDAWRCFHRVVAFREESGAILFTTEIPAAAVYDEAHQIWHMPPPEPTWRQRSPLL